MTATLALPLDVRLTEGLARVLFALAGVTLLAAAAAWAVRGANFPVRAIQIDGDLQRNSVSTIRANAMPRLAGNFFSLDLERARGAFESVPWVRRAVVRRVWPDRLSVRLEEHRAVALWKAADDNDRLVNNFGEVFEANLGDVEDDRLPVLAGPPGSAPQMLAMLQALQPLFAQQDRLIESLALSGRGSWRVELDGGAPIELGRGADAEVLARAQRFVGTLSQVSAHFGAPLLAADLRHPDGYALRLRNVTTPTVAPRALARKP
jgi:cell division protein FtsQ